ncbi:putative 4-coumarate:coenzyme a ligase [Rosellinia necatrix]|uniref:Putative 4-coumarate:coenzyme a ligase n=1 Tax=Rosellinia necatrix TaxID=77044 RepID=A0A1S7ULG2_ROSNE|nr:putative 4-coumarate:coenzyme a ligase [Rosellinia necatrix]
MQHNASLSLAYPASSAVHTPAPHWTSTNLHSNHIPHIIKMPVRIPAARGSETAIFGMAGVASLAPLYMMLPGAEERLAAQTARWAPRWERSISRFAAPAERLAQRAEPRIARTVQKIDNKLPLEKMAQNVDRRIKNGIDRMGRAV